MKLKLIIFLALSALAQTSFAHRLNEYLQATTISLAPGKIQLEITLTPGVDVVTTLLKAFDDQQAYATKLAHDLSLTLDGQKADLQLVSYSFPTVEALQKGTGDIIIEFAANIGNERQTHHLELKNNHYSTIAVYLVNCLMPADPTTHVDHQTRNNDQSFYQLDFTTGSTKPQTPTTQNQPIAKTYFIHGIRHILTGYDHLLFLCALVLGAAGLWDLIKIVTAFTIAHSLTLTLAVLGLAHLPTYIVEPCIAASIVFVAAQNILWPRYATGTSRLAIAFFFGLFHGLGFAGGILQLMHAMPANLIVYAILGFSAGVEAGNQLVLLPLYAMVQTIKKNRQPTYLRLASALVAVAGLYYLVIALTNSAV